MAKKKIPDQQEGQLSVWHIPQVPGATFRVDVANLVEGVVLENS